MNIKVFIIINILYKLFIKTKYIIGGDIIKKIIKAMLTLTAFSVLTRFLGFLYKIYLSRIMSTYELGVYSLTLSVYMVLITIVSSSIPLTISKITSNNKTLNKEYNTHHSVTSSIILSTIISIIIVILLLISKPLLIWILGGKLGYEIIITLIPSIIFSALYSQIRGYLWGYENYFSVSIVEFIEQILRIIFCMAFVSLDIFSSPVVSVGVALSVACGISTIYGYYLYFKNKGRIKYKSGYFKEIIKSTLPLTAVRLFGSILQPVVAIILPIILGNFGIDKELAVSELGVALGMTMPLLSIPSTIIGSLCMILVPRISSHNQETSTTLNEQIENYINFSIICIMVFVPIFIVLGVPMGKFIFSNSLAGIYISNSSWIIIPMGIAQITTSILNALNQEQKTFIYYIISSIFMFLVILVTPKFLGTMSMLYSIGISNIVLSILNVIKIKKLTSYSTKITNKILTQIMLILPIILLTKITYNWSSIITSKLISLIICSVISVIGYIVLIFSFNIIDFRLIKNLINSSSKSQKNKTT